MSYPEDVFELNLTKREADELIGTQSPDKTRQKWPEKTLFGGTYRKEMVTTLSLGDGRFVVVTPSELRQYPLRAIVDGKGKVLWGDKDAVPTSPKPASE